MKILFLCVPDEDFFLCVPDADYSRNASCALNYALKVKGHQCILVGEN